MTKHWAYQKFLVSLCLAATLGITACGGDEGGDESPKMDASVEPDQAMSPDVGGDDASAPCECQAETTCNVEGECAICSGDNECAEGRICQDGACRDGCTGQRCLFRERERRSLLNGTLR